MAYSHNRVSRLASSCPKDFNFELFAYQNEVEYPHTCNKERFLKRFLSLPDDTIWNSAVCLLSIVCLALALVRPTNAIAIAIDIVYDLIYLIHVVTMVFDFLAMEDYKPKCYKIFGFVLDVISYFHYFGLLFTSTIVRMELELFCYLLRLHRTFEYFWTLSTHNLKGSIIGTFLLYMYTFIVARIIGIITCIHIEPEILERLTATPSLLDDRNATHELFMITYMMDVLFLPIGMITPAQTDTQRLKIILITLVGRLMVNGAAVSSLSLVISIYMRPHENFRARFSLIMKEMIENQVPVSLRTKVETFYRMYWEKQSAVSETQLLPIFPHTIPITIYTDIYFEAQQKSVVMRDLSYQFLWEVAKTMSTIHYIPGDAIIQKNINKSSIIYIAYGDVEMITAEDNTTPILRMTRGSILNGSGCCAALAGVSAPLDIRAATFCTAHVLRAQDLWRVALKYGRQNGQVFILASSLQEHMAKVKMHFNSVERPDVKYKSSIKHFKQNLIDLKEGKDENGKYIMDREDYFLEIAGCYLMRNQTDRSLLEESDEICLRPSFPYILQPHSSLLVFWHALISLLIVIVCCTHPYTLVFAYPASPEFRFFDYCLTVMFLLDLLVHLSTGTNVEEGVPITFSQTSSQQVQSIWFIVDVLATLPIFEFVGGGQFAGINKLLRLPKVFRVLKQMEEVWVHRVSVLRLCSYTLLIFFSCYIVGTMLHAFFCFYHGYCEVISVTKSPFWGESTLKNDDTVSVTLTWYFSLYVGGCLATFTSHTLQTWRTDDVYNVLFQMILLEILMILNILIEAVYSATITVSSAMRCDYDTTIENVRKFLIINDMDPMLRHRFIKYLQLCWYTDKAYAITHDKLSIFFDLPPHVYTDMVAVHRSKYLLCLPFMKYVHQGQVKELSSLVRLFYTSPNEILLNTGDISNEIYVIKKGICEVLDPDTKKSAGLIGGKKYFGVLECIFRIPAFYTVRAVTHVQVYSISNKHLKKIMSLPRITDAVEHCKTHIEYRRLRRHREPFLWYSPPPAPPNSTRFPLPRKHIGDHAYMMPFQRLGVLSIIRYVTPRVTIRPDGMYIARYEWFRALCSLLSAFIFPGYIYMVHHWQWLYYISLCLDITAYLDIVQRMLVGYYDAEGILVSHPASAAAHYITGAFLIDLLGCLPFETFEHIKHVNRDTVWLMSTAQFLMLNRLLQLYRLPGAMDVLQLYIDRRDYILIIKSSPVFLALLNVFTCVVVFYSCNIYVTGNWPNCSISIQPLADPNGSWIHNYNFHLRYNMTENPLNLHLTAYFWVVYVYTSTGYDIFIPSNLDLVKIMLLSVFLSAMIRTYFIVSVISIRSNVSKELANFQANMKDMNHFMTREKLDKNLQRDVRLYYAYNWEKLHGLDYRIVLKLCDQITLRTDAILHIYGHTFNKCPILFHCDLSLLRVLGRAVHSVYFRHDTTIIERDDVIDVIYIVDYGEIEIIDDDGTCINLLKGSMFGNLDNYTTMRFPNTATTVSSVHLLQINTLLFHDIIKDFPTVSVLMKKHRPKKEMYIKGNHDVNEAKIRERMSISLMTGKKQTINYFSKKKAIAVRILEIVTILMSLIVIYADIYNAGFNDNSPWLIIMLYVLDGMFYFRILLNFLLPLVFRNGDTKHLLIMNMKRYLKAEFKYDVLSILPLELFCLLEQDDKEMWRMFSWLRLNRLFRVAAIESCISRHRARLSSNIALTTIASVSIWFTMFIHTVSCMWYALGMWEDSIEPNSSWIHPHPRSRRADMSLPLKGYESSQDTREEICGNHYICSAYFVMTTFVQNGIGDILPRQQIEIVFVCILQIMSTLIFMVYVGEFSNIIQYQSFRPYEYFIKYLELKEFLKNNRVSLNLVSLVSEYSLHLWREGRGRQTPHFLDHAPHATRLSIMSAAYGHHLAQHPAFADCEPAFLRQLAGCLKPFTYSKNLFVVKDSEITDSMYIIHRGKVQELDEDLDTSTHGHVYHEGEHFGMLQGLVRNTPFTYSYRTMSKCQVLTLSLDSWEFLLEHFPASRRSLYRDVPGSPHITPTDLGDRAPTPTPGPTSDQGPLETDHHDDDDDYGEQTKPRRLTVFEKARQSEPDLVTAKSEARVHTSHELPEQSEFKLPFAEMSMVEKKPSIAEIGPSMETELMHDSNPMQDSKKIHASEHDNDDMQPSQSVMSVESDMDIVRRETLRGERRKTLFQKFTEGAKKLVTQSERRDTVGELVGEGMDSLLLQEEMAMTSELADELEGDEKREEKRYKQLQHELKAELERRRPEKRGVRLMGEEFPDATPEDDYEKKTAEEVQYIARRASRLSFLPGLVAEGYQVPDTSGTTPAPPLKPLIASRQSVATQSIKDKRDGNVKPPSKLPLTIRDDNETSQKATRRIEDIKRNKGTFYQSTEIQTDSIVKEIEKSVETTEKQTQTQTVDHRHRDSASNTEFYAPITSSAPTVETIEENDLLQLNELKILKKPELDTSRKTLLEESGRKGITLADNVSGTPNKPASTSETDERELRKARISRRITRIHMGEIEADDDDFQTGENDLLELSAEEMELKEAAVKRPLPKTKEQIEKEKADETRKFFHKPEEESDTNIPTLSSVIPLLLEPKKPQQKSEIPTNKEVLLEPTSEKPSFKSSESIEKGSNKKTFTETESYVTETQQQTTKNQVASEIQRDSQYGDSVASSSRAINKEEDEEDKRLQLPRAAENKDKTISQAELNKLNLDLGYDVQDLTDRERIRLLMDSDVDHNSKTKPRVTTELHKKPKDQDKNNE